MSHHLKKWLLHIFSNSLPTLSSLQARSSIYINLSLSPPHCHPSTKFNNCLLSSDRASQCKTKCISFPTYPLVHCLQILSSPLSPSTCFYCQLRNSSPQFRRHTLDPLTPNIYTSCLTLTLDLTRSAWSVAPLELPNSPLLPSRYCLSTSAQLCH